MIEINIILLLKVLGIGFLVSNFQPIQWVLQKLPEGQVKWNLMLLFGCLKCFSFWTALIWTFNIWFSIFVFFIASSVSGSDFYKYWVKKIGDDIERRWVDWRIKLWKKKVEKIINKLESYERNV